MKITRILASGRPTISFEFFPAKTPEGYEALKKTIAELSELKPSFVSMTYGAGGSTRQTTIGLVSWIKKEVGLEAAAHLTCVGHSKSEIESVLRELQAAGIDNIIALRGDPPKGQTSFQPHPEGFEHASELVGFIRKGFPFALGVAGYPEKHIEAPSLDKDLQHLKEKVQAGGDFVITQLFFDNKDFFRFKEKLQTLGVRVPLIAGIMPVTDFDQLKRFTQMCGASIPEVLRDQLEKAGGDKEKVGRIGIDHAVHQCRELLEKGVAGIHFYTLNRSHATRAIFTQLKEKGLIPV